VDSPVERPAGFGSGKALVIVVGGVLVLGGACVALNAMGNQNERPYVSGEPSTTPTQTPEEKFVDDMNDAFAEKLNPGKNPITDIWSYRTFKDSIAETGHKICIYLESHSYEETAQRFKLRLPLPYPSDADARDFVAIAIHDLCPQYSATK